ncbi:DinB family protein [Bacteroidota bacterium]
MIKEFGPVIEKLGSLLKIWEPKLLALPDEILAKKRNSQNRSIKQVVGHMIDSASNNIHRIVHLQYRENPMEFPNYATEGNNDRWIAIQNYQGEDWEQMVYLWKYIHLHIIHVIGNIDANKLDSVWNDASEHGHVTLMDMVIDFPRHFELHIDEIQELMES